MLCLGLMAYPAYRGLWNYLLSALVFSVFRIFVFGRLVKRHTGRIGAYTEERHFFLRFFDVRSFAIMAVMMTGGIGLRASGLAPGTPSIRSPARWRCAPPVLKAIPFRWMWLTIVLSFGFYIPVVLWADAVPLIGMLMIPKTCAYVWTVLIGYSAMKKECG